MAVFLSGAPIVLIILLCFSFAVLGAVMGSFASAIAYRVLQGESWIFTKKDDGRIPARSRCPSCGHSLAWYDLIPVFSWSFMCGKCRYCREKISVRYPIVEIFGALLLLGVFLCGVGAFILISFLLALPFALAWFLVMLGGRGFQYPAYLWAGMILDSVILCYILLEMAQRV